MYLYVRVKVTVASPGGWLNSILALDQHTFLVITQFVVILIKPVC